MMVRKLLFRLTFFILLAAMLISGSILVQYMADSLQQRKDYAEQVALLERSRADAVSQTLPSAEDSPPVETAPSILPEYAVLYEENSDLVGWMTIDGTPIHYPVMQSPARVDFYLNHSFKREPNSHGCLYVRESCNVFAPSDNLTIYGHHMRDGTMFASLDKYRNEEFFLQYPSIRFDTIYQRQTYTIFAVFTTTASAGRGFSYHLFEDAADEAAFQDFVSACKALALYDTGITPRYGDKLICLSTCEYSNTNGRLVVAAVRD